MKKLLLVFILLVPKAYGMVKVAAKAETESVKLLVGDAATPPITIDIIKQSPTLKYLIEEVPPGQPSFPVPGAKNLTQLTNLIDIMRALKETPALQDKKVQEFIKEATVTPLKGLPLDDKIDLLRLANYLDLAPIVLNTLSFLVAQNITQEMWDQLKVRSEDAIPLDVQQLIAKYYWIRTGKKLLGKDGKLYDVGYSIEESLDAAEKIDMNTRLKDGTLDLSYLDIDNLSGLEKIPGIKNITALKLGLNRLRSIKPGTFQELSQLKSLSLTDNKLSEIKPGAFQGLSQLESLSLNYNKLSDINLGAFKGLSKLKGLFLNYNKLSDINPGVFQELSQLESLSLVNNKLSDINLAAFQGLSQLMLLYLENNKLSDIKPGTFQGLSKLKILYLSNNKLSDPDTFRKELDLIIKNVTVIGGGI